MRIDLTKRPWQLTMAWPWAPVLGKSLETGGELLGLFPPVPARVPGSVQADLLRAGLIPDPYKGINSLSCEWVESKWSIYETNFCSPPLSPGSRAFLVLRGVDFAARIYLDGQEIARHEGLFVPCETEITPQLTGTREHTLRVVIEEAPREMALGLTSRVTTQKPRFGYKWDFGTRLVNLGLGGEAYIDLCPGPRLLDVTAFTDWDGSAGILSLDVMAEPALDSWLRVRLLDPDGALCLTRELPLEQGRLQARLPLDGARPWNPLGHGDQPLYTLETELVCGNTPCGEDSKQVGFRRLEYCRCEGAGEDALPYAVKLNGKRIYLRGVNLVPLCHMYGAVPDRAYEELVEKAVFMGVNLIRVWGGGLCEKEILYRLCDRHGILLWQEFIQSSSGVENVPPQDERFLSLLETTASAMLREKRSHTCLAYWCGGNELRLTSDADTPVDLSNKNIALLASLVAELDPQRLFLPSSASGPNEFIQREAQGVSHDVHGLWKYDGPTGHYRLYNGVDSMLHSEFGCDGMSGPETIAYITGEEQPAVRDMREDVVWRFHGEWWDTTDRDFSLFGKLTDLRQLVWASQLIQGEGLRYICEADRRRAFQNAGSFIWQLNEPWPSVSSTCLIEYDGAPKMSAYFVRNAYRNAAVSLRHDGITPKAGQPGHYEVWLVSETPHSGRIDAQVLDVRGNLLFSQSHTGFSDGGIAAKAFSFEFTPPPTLENGLFFVRLRLDGDQENVYFFGTGSPTPFAALAARDLSALRVTKQQERGWELCNAGPTVLPYLFVRSPEGGLFSDNCITLFPGESRTIRALGNRGDEAVNIL